MRKKILLVLIAALLIITPAVMAQEVEPNPSKTVILMSFINLIAGFAISWAVSGLKKFTLVQNNPKWVAAVLAGGGSVLVAYFGGGSYDAALMVLASFLEQLAAAIGTFETVIKPVSEAGAK